MVRAEEEHRLTGGKIRVEELGQLHLCVLSVELHRLRKGVTVRERVLCPGESAGGTASWGKRIQDRYKDTAQVSVKFNHQLHLYPDVHLLIRGLLVNPATKWSRHFLTLRYRRPGGVSRGDWEKGAEVAFYYSTEPGQLLYCSEVDGATENMIMRRGW